MQREQTRFRRWGMAYASLRVATVAISLLLVALLSTDALFGSGLVPLPSRQPERAAQAAPSPALERGLAEATIVEQPAEPALAAAPAAEGTPSTAEQPSQPASATGTPGELQGLAAAEKGRPVVEAQAAPLESAPAASAEGMRVGAAPGTKDTGEPVVESEREAAVRPDVSEQATAEMAVEPVAQPTQAVAQPEAKAAVVAATAVQAESVPAADAPEPAAPTLAAAEPESVAEQSLTTSELSPMWQLWRIARLGSALLLGLLCVAIAGLIWSRQNSRT